MEPTNGLGILAVTKDLKMEQERQHIFYDFYLTTAPMFEPPTGYRHIGDEQLPTPPHVELLEAFHMENAMEDKGALRLMVEEDFFNQNSLLQSAYMYSRVFNMMHMKVFPIRQRAEK